MLVLSKGGLFRRYAIVGRFSSGKLTEAKYYSNIDSALAGAGFWSNNSIPYDVYVWNRLHKAWYKVLTVNP